jgi:hypothetical protein
LISKEHADVYWIRRALLMALLTHPYVKDTAVTYPDIGGRPQEPVAIKRGRLFGGPELIESGLTLAVYPYHSAYDPVVCTPTGLNGQSVLYPTAGGTLGGVSRSSNSKGYLAQMRFIVQLYLRDTVYNAPTNIKASFQEPDVARDNSYYGYNFQFEDDRLPEFDTLQSTKEFLVNSSQVSVQVLPGEEILTQWLDIIKYAVRDIKVLRPFMNIRNPVVLTSDYPTSSWTTKPANLIFHTAYHVVQFDVLEPELESLVDNPNIQAINISTSLH